MSTGEIRVLAPAKVNLTLRVGPPRDDGYHPLDSLVMFADWGDEVRVRSGPGLLLSMSGEASRGLDAGASNLVLSAARALQSAARLEDGAIIHLHKDIPVAAGLGGGSSDAAATLRALNRLWGLNWPLDRLAQLGLELGADVPACIYARSLRMRGIGEWIEVLDGVPSWPAVIVNPGIAMPTGPVFKTYDAGEPRALTDGGWARGGLIDWLHAEGNDLEAPAIAREPRIADTLEWLNAQDGTWLVRMTGSGASCFALCDDAHSAARIAADYPGFARAVELGADPARGQS
ncbi:4-(cytidine 5'-diphospho)-2-C-methyl-D-erythritol kinase [Maricaulis sp. CAU 1757]